MKYSLFILFLILLNVSSVNILADTEEFVCLKTDKIRSVDFKKDFMIFEMQKRNKYNEFC